MTKDLNSTGSELEEKFYQLLEETQREGIDGVIDWLKEENAHRCPCSTKPGRHGAYPGGLMDHSYTVYELLKEKNERYNLGLEEDTIRITGLLHDVCKVGSYEENILKSGQISEKQPYRYRDKLTMGHGDKSVYRILSKGLKLTDQEAQMIRWHMGPWDQQFHEFETGSKVKEQCPEAIALFTADYESTVFMD